MFRLLRDPLLRSSLFIFLSQIAASGLGFVFWIVASRYYPQNDVGVAAAILSSVSLVILVSRLGLDQSVIRYFPSHDKGSVLTTAVVVTTSLAFILGLIYVILAQTWSSELEMLFNDPLIFLVLILVTSILSIFTSALIALRRSELYLVQNLLLGFRIPLLLPLALIGAVGILVSTTAASIVAVVVMIPILGSTGIRLKNIDSKFLKDSFAFSVSNYFSTLFVAAPASLLPIIALVNIGAENAAIYYIVYMIASVIYIIPTALGLSLFVEGSHGQPLMNNVSKNPRRWVSRPHPTGNSHFIQRCVDFGVDGTRLRRRILPPYNYGHIRTLCPHLLDIHVSDECSEEA